MYRDNLDARIYIFSYPESEFFAALDWPAYRQPDILRRFAGLKPFFFGTFSDLFMITTAMRKFIPPESDNADNS